MEKTNILRIDDDAKSKDEGVQIKKDSLWIKINIVSMIQNDQFALAVKNGFAKCTNECGMFLKGVINIITFLVCVLM